jgi:hypothetical protein
MWLWHPPASFSVTASGRRGIGSSKREDQCTTSAFSQWKSGRTSAPRLPHTLQTNSGSISDSRVFQADGAGVAGRQGAADIPVL